MKLTEVELTAFALPFERPYATAAGELDGREMYLLRLQTDAGIEGLGEAVPLSLRGGPDLRAVFRGLLKGTRRLRRADLSDFAGDEPFLAAVDAFVHTAAGRRLPGASKAAIEMAILDLAGKASSRPVHALLGIERPEPVRCNATLVAGSPDEVAADAERWAVEGFESFKLKLGTGDDVAQVRAVREAVGPGARIRVDANGAWSVEEALGILRMIEPLDVELVEQPVADRRGMAAVRRGTAIPVAADETVSSGKEARQAATDGEADLAAVKLAKVGGIGESNGIAAHLPIYLSSALDGPLGIAAAAHAAQALEFSGPAVGLAHGLATQRLFARTTATTQCELRGADLVLPPGPGLGVELDESALESLRI